MLHALLAGQYVLANLAVPVGASLATIWASTKLARRTAANDIADHDRRAAEINEDLRRWMHDRDREAAVRLSEISQDASSKGVISSGLLAQAAGKVYRHVLHEYRDRATVAERGLDALLAAEGKWHMRRRRRETRPAPELILTEGCRTLLEQWRQRAEDDPSNVALEPRLAQLERPWIAA